MNSLSLLKMKIFSLFIAVSISASCSNDNDKVAQDKFSKTQNVVHNTDRGYITIENKKIGLFIREYIKENNLRDRKSIIFLTIRRSSGKMDYFLTHSYNKLKYISSKPHNYAVMDSSLIFVYSGIENITKPSEEIQKNIEGLMTLYNYKLSDTYILEHNLVWWINDCDGVIRVQKSNYFEESLPCGYDLIYKDKKPILIKNANKD